MKTCLRFSPQIPSMVSGVPVGSANVKTGRCWVFQCISSWNISPSFSALLWHLKVYTYTFWKHLESKDTDIEGWTSSDHALPTLANCTWRGLPCKPALPRRQPYPAMFSYTQLLVPEAPHEFEVYSIPLKCHLP